MGKYSGPVPTVKQSIAAIEKSGEWSFVYYNSPWYVFRSQTRGEQAFTIQELRHAAAYGW